MSSNIVQNLFISQFFRRLTQSGVQAVRNLREEKYPKLVVGVTGNILDDDVLEYLHAGADMVIGKPVKMVLLKKLLDFVKEHGTLSRPGMYLSEDEQGGLLTWKYVL